MHHDPASGPVRVLGDQLLHPEAAQSVGQPFHQAEVQLTDGGRIGSGHLGERAAAEGQLHAPPQVHPHRTEPPSGRLLVQQLVAGSGPGELGGPASPLFTTDLAATPTGSSASAT